MERFAAVIVAAGTGTRMGASLPKQYLSLGDRPVIVHTLEVFQRLEEAETIVLVAGPHDEERCRKVIGSHGLSKVANIVAGGTSRQESVFKGLLALPSSTRWVLVHDGVRPLVTPDDIRNCFHAALRFGAAVLAVPVKDTIKQVDESGRVVSTPDRKNLWAVQTPQAFRYSDLLKAHQRAREEQFSATDDASLVEWLGMDVYAVKGDYGNLKITTPEDLLVAETIRKARQEKGETKR